MRGRGRSAAILGSSAVIHLAQNASFRFLFPLFSWRAFFFSFPAARACGWRAVSVLILRSSSFCFLSRWEIVLIFSMIEGHWTCFYFFFFFLLKQWPIFSLSLEALIPGSVCFKEKTNKLRFDRFTCFKKNGNFWILNALTWAQSNRWNQTASFRT